MDPKPNFFLSGVARMQDLTPLETTLLLQVARTQATQEVTLRLLKVALDVHDDTLSTLGDSALAACYSGVVSTLGVQGYYPPLTGQSAEMP